jgi:hypothetical protein
MKISSKKAEILRNYSLNCVRCWPSTRARLWSENFVEDIAKNTDVIALIVVGSATREVTNIADIDFIIIYCNKKPFIKNPPIDVDIRSYDHAMVQNMLSEGHDLLGWAIKMGCVVFERHHYWTKLRSRWINRLKFPSGQEARDRAAKAEKLYGELRAIGDDDAAAEQLMIRLSQLARACLIEAGVYPASRPELPQQLRAIGAHGLADELSEALERRV